MQKFVDFLKEQLKDPELITDYKKANDKLKVNKAMLTQAINNVMKTRISNPNKYKIIIDTLNSREIE
jgi:hypothetical protein